MNIIGHLKNSFIDYPGHISTIIFTPGCNFRCWYCHNSDILDASNGKISQEEIFKFLDERKGFLDGLVISGGEPTLQSDLKEFIIEARKHVPKIKLDTNGTNPDILKDLNDSNLIDFVAMDIKCELNRYDEIVKTKVDVEKILESIQILLNSNIQYEFRTTFAPDITIRDIEEIGKTIKGAKTYFIQKYVYHPGQTEMILHNKSAYEAALEVAKKYVHNSHLRGM